MEKKKKNKKKQLKVLGDKEIRLIFGGDDKTIDNSTPCDSIGVTRRVGE